MLKCKIDSNHTEIVDQLFLCGCSVQSLATIGNGCPDILVGYKGYNFVFEIKTEKGKLNQRQKDWFHQWDGEVMVIRSIYDALEIMIGHIISCTLREVPKHNEYWESLIKEKEEKERNQVKKEKEESAR